jgi:soluble P-type ATPase
MIQIQIPGSHDLEIENVLLDFNGTIAVDGRLIQGVKEKINHYSDQLAFHVITADTFGSVQKQLENVKCTLHILSQGNQAAAKLAYLDGLGSRRTIGVGNGANDEQMLKHALLGVAVLGTEGLATKTLAASDILVRDILDLFAFFERPNRLAASLRQ